MRIWVFLLLGVLVFAGSAHAQERSSAVVTARAGTPVVCIVGGTPHYRGQGVVALRESDCRRLERAAAGWRPTHYTGHFNLGFAVYVLGHELAHMAQEQSALPLDEYAASCIGAGGFYSRAASFTIRERFADTLVSEIRGLVGYEPRRVARCF
jgi:hypothetical protein